MKKPKPSRHHKLIGLLAEIGIKHVALADAIGITRQSFYNKLHGYTRFHYEEVLKICEILNIENPREYFPVN